MTLQQVPPPFPRTGATDRRRLAYVDGEYQWMPTTRINLLDFDITPSDGNDHTSEVQAALTQATAEARSGLLPTLELPHGDLNVSELDWSPQVPIEGAEAGMSRFVYAGAGGAGTYIFRVPTSVGYVPYTGFRRVTFKGWHGGANDTICEHLLTWVTPAGVDWGFRCDDVHFRDALGSAVDMSGSAGIINLHLDRVRFDNLGGYGMDLKATVGAESRPITLTRWTMDTNASATFLARVNSAYNTFYVDSSTWGKGLVKFASTGAGNYLHIAHGRFEGNKKLTPVSSYRAVCHDLTAAGSSGAFWHFEHVVGYVLGTTSAALLRSESLKVGFAMTGFVSIEKGRLHVYTGDVDGPESLPIGGVPGASHKGPATTVPMGQFDNGHYKEARESVPTSANQTFFRKGDWWIQRQPTAGSTGIGQVCTAPTTYGQMGGTTQLTALGVVTNGSAVVDMSGDTGNFYRGFPGAAVTLTGAGVAAADLATAILSVDDAAFTWTLAAAVSTSVNPCTIRYTVPTFRDFGDIVTYGTAAPVSGTFAKAEKRWNTNPSELGSASSKYVIVGWICTVAGTPGTWVELRCLTGN